MRRILVAIAMAALVGSTLAFAPALTAQQEAETDHELVFTHDGAQTVEGAATNAGTNPGWPAPEGCTKDPNTYCETVHVTVEQPVVDEDPDSFEFGTGEVAFTLAPAVPGADFDVVVYESDETGASRGEVVADSGNFPGCSVLCETPLSLLIGDGCGSEHDECGTWAVSTSELAGTRYYVMEVVYYLAGGGYTLEVAYDRTDDRGSDGTTGGDQSGSYAQADPTHEVTFSEDGSASVEGGLPGGFNLSPFVDGTSICTGEPDHYCETILLTIEQPVADEDPDEIEFGLGTATVDITAAVPGSDFDLFVYESDAAGNKGTAVANSGNAAACAQACGTVPDPVGLWANQCDGSDECVEFGVTTSEFSGTRHYLVEVVYFASPAGYTGELTYTRTDGRNFDGTTPPAAQ